ncbi:glutamate-binding protein [Actinophytocola xinjiangensis]|uniref:Glutamate-binding protein n=1 Tax=Actinophytocola xinjiangensis TaxID=485602 RepID=A0A7Z1ASX4_9PSEU|nr:glutamate ABC transporter substrate-binding protein [Actinophytocola xinjiangensis]OLF04318.1 glutamate-binding protein [Actinophytocola xinjiangensis]
MRFSRVLRAGAVAAAATLALAACGGGGDDSGSGDGGGDGGGVSFDNLVIGIKFDQPGVGQKTPDGYAGFDVDVAKYVAKELGVDESKIEFIEAKSPDREQLIKRGDVDFIVASYSISDKRKEEVTFAGPYFVAHQDLLLSADNTSIASEEDLKSSALKLCSVTGSTSAQNVRDDFAPQAQLQEYSSYSQCLTGVESGQLDALTTDDTILAGYAAQPANQGKFKLAGLNLSDEFYGIGLEKGNTELQSAINDAIKKMIDDGSWAKFVESNLGPAGYETPEAPEITETS